MRKSEIRRQREQEIISSLNKLGIADVEIVKRLNISNLGETSDRNVLRVLNKMVDDGLLDCMRKDIKLFTIKGKGFGHYEHRLLMNRFLVRKGLFHKARIEPKIKIGNDSFQPDFIVPMKDGILTAKDYIYYEVDRRQKRKANMLKIDRYNRLGLKFEIVCPSDRTYMWKGCVIHEINV